MWQLYALGALGTEALKRIFDKAAIVQTAAIDTIVAALYRTGAFFLFSTLFAFSGLFGPIVFEVVRPA